MEKTKNYYDAQNRLTDANKVDVQTGGEINTSHYIYNAAQSGSSDQPYSVTDAAGFTQYFQYDLNGNQTQSWYNWVDPNNSQHTHTVTNYTVCDSLNRATETRRQIDSAQYFVLSKTTYTGVGEVNTVENEFGVITKYEYDPTGRPLGGESFVARLEKILERMLMSQKPGSKPNKKMQKTLSDEQR